MKSRSNIFYGKQGICTPSKYIMKIYCFKIDVIYVTKQAYYG